MPIRSQHEVYYYIKRMNEHDISREEEAVSGEIAEPNPKAEPPKNLPAVDETQGEEEEVKQKKTFWQKVFGSY